ncbi:MAG: DNA-processing protein DprA [Hyphomonadaceae bacterium]
MKNRSLSDRERADWLRLSRTPQVGPVTFAQLIARYGTASNALEALPELAKRAGRKRPLVAPSRSSAEDEIAATQRYGATLLCSCEAAYPALLREVNPPPPVLSVLGRTELFDLPAIAIVGARNASAAGRKIARDMAADLGKAGYCVVSGLARGVDGEAHAAALETGTIAVLGGGVDHIYPPQHDRLYAAVAADGCIVSESPLGHKATARDFPRRNRLITGLALGTIVVEAADRSGSLISARTANEQGREVMAVPGSPLDPRAAGTNRLIQQGASLVRSADDVLEIITGLGQRRMDMPPAPEFELEPEGRPPIDQISRVLEALSYSPTSLDEIARAADIGAARCAAILMELELAGDAVTLAGGLAVLAVSGD